jgi:regulator of protease activity HflC (stomatin/prohibitin superfamily)
MVSTNEIINAITDILAVVTPLIVAILTVIIKRNSDRDKKYKALQAEIDAEREKAREEKEKDREAKLEEIQKTMEAMTSEIKKIQTTKIEEQLKQLKVLNEFNFEYIQALSNVVTSMGETIVNSPIGEGNEKLENVIKTFRTAESTLVNNLYKIIS